MMKKSARGGRADMAYLTKKRWERRAESEVWFFFYFRRTRAWNHGNGDVCL